MRLDGNCTMKCWGMAGAFGVLAFLLLLGKGFATALFLGVLACVMLGVVFTWLFCAPIPKSTYVSKPVVSATEAEVAPAPAAPVAPVTESPAAVAAEPVETDAAAPAAGEPAQAVETEAVAASTPAAENSGPTIKPSTPLAGEAELAERKGSWTYSKDGPAAGAAEVDRAKPAAEPAQVAPAASEPVIKPSTPLAGEAELAERKGDWTYSKDGAPAGAAQSDSDLLDEDFDGDGVEEGTNEGEKPELLDGPRDGKADDLKQIKGIGPKLEKMCHSIGVYHFDQIAAWSDDEVAWVDANLVGFKGRVSRDKWRDQAQILAEGGETAFSKRVEKGGVY